MTSESSVGLLWRRVEESNECMETKKNGEHEAQDMLEASDILIGQRLHEFWATKLFPTWTIDYLTLPDTSCSPG